MLVDEEQKAQAFFAHFDAILGNYEERACSLDFQLLGIPQLQLISLDCCFFKYEVWAMIRQLPSEKTPNLDGFMGLFYKIAWPIIKGDVLNAFKTFWSMDFMSLYLVNQAYMTLLQKKEMQRR
jgi:hypothetical protein